MNQATLKRRQAVKRAIVYTAMTMTVLIITALLVLFTLGYRFNRDNGTFLQGGLVQFISKPSGASVTVGRASLANKTRSKITLNPGGYLVKMNLDGYQEWQKNIEVDAGKVLWLNSALFVPKDPQTTSLTSMKNLSSTAFRSDGKYLALMASAKKPDIRLMTTSEGKLVDDKTLTIPVSLYASGKSHRFEVTEWDGDSEWLLVRHTVGKKTEWIAINTADITKSRTVVSQSGATPIDILFDPRGNDRLIVLYDDGTVRFMNTSSGEVTTPAITNAAEISLGGNWTVVYTTIPQGGTHSVGYLTLGAKKPREIAAYPDDKPLSAAIGSYYGTTYMAITHGKTATVSRVKSWPASDSDSPLSVETLHTSALPENGAFTSFRGQGRFVAFQQATTQSVYDLELAHEYAVPVVGVKKKMAEKLDWIDTFHFWNDASGYFRQYEFDGTNQAAIVKVAPGFDAAYDGSQRYLYTVGKSGKTFALQATKMVIE